MRKEIKGVVENRSQLGDAATRKTQKGAAQVQGALKRSKKWAIGGGRMC